MNIAPEYYDFKGLVELRNKADDEQVLAAEKVGTQFEALFFQMMLKSLREASKPLKSELFNSASMETYEQMFDVQLSQHLATRDSLGISNWLIEHLENTGSLRAGEGKTD